MNKIVEEAIQNVNESYLSGNYMTTRDVRKLSSKLFRQIEDKSIDNVLFLYKHC